MKSKQSHWIFLAAVLAGIHAGPARGQVASSLLNEGDEVDPLNFPGHLVTTINGVTINGIGGFAATINTSDGVSTLSHIWGSVDGITPGAILRTESTVAGFVQDSFANRVGLSDTGSLFYESVGPVDVAFLDDTPIMVEADPTPPGPIGGLFWSSALQATKMSANGRMFFVGGTSATSGGGSSAYGMFADNPPQPLQYTGMGLPGVPAIIDNQSGAYSSRFRLSRDGNEYLTRTAMETTGTGIPSGENECMVISGIGLYIDGALVQEGTPVPASIGGLAGENWSAFGSTDFGINEMGEYIFGTDTSAATSQDEFVVLNGQIVLREGQSLGGTLTSTIETVDINENGDWAVVWKRGGTALEVIIVNGQVVLADGAEVDRDGDGIIDPGVIFADLDVINDDGLHITERDAGGDVTLYFNLDANDGSGNVEGIYRMVLPMPAGAAGDLQLGASDTPDPQITVPGNIAYKVTVRNDSPAAIDNVVVTSILDPTLAFNAGASDPIAMHSAGTVTASLGTMAANAVQTYTFVATANTAGTKTTTHSVAGDTADTVPGNNDVTSTTDVGSAAELQVSIADSPDPVVTPGGTITYTVTSLNQGPSPATGVEVTMNLDPTTTFNAGLSDPGLTHLAGVVTIPVGSLANGGTDDAIVVVNVTTQGVISADASITGNEPDPIPENNTATVETLFQLTTDLTVAISDSPDPVIPAGGAITYEVTTTNNGPSGASGVVATVTLDDDTVFVSTEAPGIHDGSPTGGVVTAAIGNLNNGQSFTFDIVVNTTMIGNVAVEGQVAGGGNETDPNAANNIAVATTLVLNDLSRFATGVFSNIGGSPTSQVPGLPGAQFGTGVDQPFRSPNGKWWILSADTDLPTSSDEVIIVGSLCSADTVVQEGVTGLGLGDAVGLIDQPLSINDAGRFVFATNTNAATTADEVIVRWDGSLFVDVAREGDVSAGATLMHGSTVLYSTNINAPNITNDDFVWFNADTDVSDGNLDHFLFDKNGNVVVAQEGVTVPGNQGGGATEPWDNMDTDELRADASGLNWMAQGDLLGGTSVDDVFVVNNNVVVQEGFVLPGSGYASPVDTIDASFAGRMMANGDWFVRGTNANDEDWVIRNGSVIAETGAPIHAGTAEVWDDATFADGFFLFAGNNAGDYIVGGLTDSLDTAADAVLVLNNEVLISRENDPVDLDGNGVLDDGVRVRTFGNEDIILTDDLQAYVVCTLRAMNDNGSNTDIGDAYIRYNLCGIAGPCGDLNNDKVVDGVDYGNFLAAFGEGVCDAQYHICADRDGDGVITLVDYQHWLLCYGDFVGDPGAPAPALTNPADADADEDVDLADFAAFQRCSNGGPAGFICGARFDLDHNGTVDQFDFTGFAAAVTGP